VNAYRHLAAFYDRLTRDVDYEALATHYEQAITQNGRQPDLVLDLACGTGRLTRMLAKRGYQMIGVDISAEMLSQAAGEGGDILYLQQSLVDLDLYGTVDAAICTLDSLNYLPPEALEQALRRIFLFLAPGSPFAFDLNTPEKLKRLDGELFCDEQEDLLCLWRCTFEESTQTCNYDLDIFEKNGPHWLRHQESHTQHAYSEATMCHLLEKTGFTQITTTGTTDRTFYTTLRP